MGKALSIASGDVVIYRDQHGKEFNALVMVVHEAPDGGDAPRLDLGYVDLGESPAESGGYSIHYSFTTAPFGLIGGTCGFWRYPPGRLGQLSGKTVAASPSDLSEKPSRILKTFLEE